MIYEKTIDILIFLINVGLGIGVGFAVIYAILSFLMSLDDIAGFLKEKSNHLRDPFAKYQNYVVRDLSPYVDNKVYVEEDGCIIPIRVDSEAHEQLALLKKLNPDHTPVISAIINRRKMEAKRIKGYSLRKKEEV